MLQHGALFNADAPGLNQLHAQAAELLQDPRVDTNAAYWSTLHRLVLLGQLDTAMTLLAHHPVAQASQNDGMANLVGEHWGLEWGVQAWRLQAWCMALAGMGCNLFFLSVLQVALVQTGALFTHKLLQQRKDYSLNCVVLWSLQARGFEELYQLLRTVPRLGRQTGSTSVMLCGGGLLTDNIVQYGQERAQWEHRCVGVQIGFMV